MLHIRNRQFDQAELLDITVRSMLELGLMLAELVLSRSCIRCTVHALANPPCPVP